MRGLSICVLRHGAARAESILWVEGTKAKSRLWSLRRVGVRGSWCYNGGRSILLAGGGVRLKISREGELSLLSHRCLFASLLCVGSSCVTQKPVHGSGMRIVHVASERCQGDRAQGCYEKGLEMATRGVTASERTHGVDLISEACGEKISAACDTLKQRLKPAERLSGRSPNYTNAAINLEITGTVTVKCIITVEGKLRDCEIFPPRTEEERELLRRSRLSAEILESLSTWRFTPALFDGQPCEAEYVPRINLSLSN